MNEKNLPLICPNCGLKGTMEDFTYAKKVIEDNDKTHDAPLYRVVDDLWVCFCKCGWISTANKWYKETEREWMVHVGLPL